MAGIEFDGVNNKIELNTGAAAADQHILFNGNAQDFYIALDDSADDLLIGLGSTVGTTPIIAIDENKLSTFSGAITVGVNDTGHDVKLFGATSGAYMLWDESADDLVLAGAAGIDLAGDIDVDGTANLDVVDIDGAVDMASTLQVDGAITSSAGATITTADNLAQLTLTSTDADANPGPFISFYRNSGSAADNDFLGKIVYTFNNDAPEVETALASYVIARDVSNGSEDIEYKIEMMTAGAVANRFSLAPTESIFNEDSVDVDFRVESNGNANMLTVNGGSDLVGIGADPDLGVGLHIKVADSSASATSHGDELVIEDGTSGANVGISILSATDGEGRINFGDSGDNDIGMIRYNHADDSMTLITSNANGLVIDSTGAVTMPLQPCFRVGNGTQNNITAGANATLIFSNEIFDVNADFNTGTYTFTAPVAGKYHFDVLLRLSGSDAAADYSQLVLIGSNRNTTLATFINSVHMGSDETIDLKGSTVLDMDAADTASARIRIQGGSNQADVDTDGSYFTGHLIG